MNAAETTPIAIVGEIAVAVWHLGYLVDEIGHQLGQDLQARSAAAAREALRRHVNDDGLPPWASRVTAERVTEWLDEVDDCVAAYHQVVQAFATAGGAAPSRRLGDGNRREVRVEDLKALLTASQTLSRTGDQLVDALGLQLPGGQVVHGYTAIVKTLYERDAQPAPV